MTMNWARPNAARMLGAAAVAMLMVFAGLAPAGAVPDGCPWDDCEGIGGTSINARSGVKSPVRELVAHRYSSTAGEIIWLRTPEAVKYEIVRTDSRTNRSRSLGTHDVLSWFMTDLQDTSYKFEVRAVDRHGRKSIAATVRLPNH